MPTLGCTGTSVSLQEFRLLGGCHRRSFARIEADGKDVELVADIELQHSQRALQSAEDFSTEHGALVVDEVQDHWLFAKVICQTNLLAVFVVESEFGRDLFIQVLFDADIF